MDFFEKFKTLRSTPVAQRLSSDPGIEFQSMSPISCPVYIELMIDGSPATFRARYAWWAFYVGVPGSNDTLNNEQEQVFKLEAYYDPIPAAGYMPLETSLMLVEQAINVFREVRALTPAKFQTNKRYPSSS